MTVRTDVTRAARQADSLTTSSQPGELWIVGASEIVLLVVLFNICRRRVDLAQIQVTLLPGYSRDLKFMTSFILTSFSQVHYVLDALSI